MTDGEGIGRGPESNTHGIQVVRTPRLASRQRLSCFTDYHWCGRKGRKQKQGNIRLSQSARNEAKRVSPYLNRIEALNGPAILGEELGRWIRGTTRVFGENTR